jgi:phosphate transport system ATP-binding protein
MNEAKKYILNAEHLNLYFGTKHVLKDISFAVAEKEVMALIGPSGCGKSTLLRCFNRMHDLTPDAKIDGHILFGGTDIYAKHAPVMQIRKRIGMVFQKPNPFAKSIYDNVVYGLKINGFDKKEIPAIVEKALRDSYLWEEVKDELKMPASKLSGGQQQRLCIARTVALRPEVILMDEPCSALDPISTAKIEALILELKKKYTIIIVTHNMQQAQRVADTTAFMYMGELIEYADTKSIFQNPVMELTKNYVSGHFG